MSRRTNRIAAALLAFAVPAAAAAQSGASVSVVPESVTIAAGMHYRAGAMHRWFSGAHYRDLWTTPIRVPVLDLHTYAGGLHPTKEGGGLQTKSLRFEGADGQEYVFRLTDKSMLSAPAEVRNSPAGGFFQDQVSALHPAGSVMAGPIVEATGVLHATATLMVMADDPALGKFRADFAGRLGMIEQYPKVPEHGEWIGGTTKIIDSPELLTRLNTDAAERVDARTFLAARLADFLMNDNDRHPGNWKWARVDSGPKNEWEPIARDRDHAFVSYDGFIVRLTAHMKPSLVLLDRKPLVGGLTEPAMLDARLLSGLEKPVWDSVAHAVQARITDSVIAVTVASMPREYSATEPRLTSILQARRDALLQSSDEFYRKLAARVEVHGTDSADRATITRQGDGIVDVKLESKGKTFFRRRFDGRETSEILVYLHGGDDTAVVTGHVDHSINVRVIGGNGTNTLIDSSTVGGNRHPTHLYEAGETRGISYGPDTAFDRLPWEKLNGVMGPHLRDEGTSLAPSAGVGYHRQFGFTPHAGITRYTYDFSDRPYSSMMHLDGEYALGDGAYRVGLTADKRLESSPLHFEAAAHVSDLEMINYFGLGNNTIDSGATSKFFVVHQTQLMFRPAIALAVGAYTDVSLGPVIEHDVTDSTQSPFVTATRPYGFPAFNEAGLQFNARYEWRSVSSAHAHHHVLLDFTGTYFPAMLDARSAFEEAGVKAGVSFTLPVPTSPLLVIRAGGKKLFGDFPYFEAATIGGMETTRYMDPDRFAGDASLYATSELRIPVVKFKFLVPLRAGVLGLAEAGRVYVDGDSPGGWNARTGEGIWLGLAGFDSAVITFARTTEPGHSGLQFHFGLNF